jgi:hypothetical protein
MAAHPTTRCDICERDVPVYCAWTLVHSPNQGVIVVCDQVKCVRAWAFGILATTDGSIDSQKGGEASK